MRRAISAFLPVVAVLALVLLSGRCAEAASRTWVASNGLDTNPCTHASPCGTFQQAVSAADAGGEVNCVDGGSFGSLSISKSITISCEAGTGGVFVNGGYGVEVTVGATDAVYLRGLDISSVPGTSIAGIAFFGNGALHVDKCLIHGFTGNNISFGIGVWFFPNGAGSLDMVDTVVADSGTGSRGFNLWISPNAVAGLATVALKNVRLLGGAAGLQIEDSKVTTVHATITDSLANGSLGDGFQATTDGGRLTMLIDHSVASNNGLVGIEADGSNTEVHVSNSTIAGNATGMVAASGATLQSYDNNVIDLNGHNGTPLSQAGLN